MWKGASDSDRMRLTFMIQRGKEYKSRSALSYEICEAVLEGPKGHLQTHPFGEGAYPVHSSGLLSKAKDFRNKSGLEASNTLRLRV